MPEPSYHTFLRLVRAHCHPDVATVQYPALVMRACAPTPDAEIVQFKHELSELLGGGMHKLPDGALYEAALYDEDNDETFLCRLHLDLCGGLP